MSKIYNGYYAMANGASWSSDPKRSAWIFCAISTSLYATTALSLVLFLLEDRVSSIYTYELYFQAAIIIFIFFFSDLGHNGTWFGIEAKEIESPQATIAKTIAIIYSIVGFMVFIFGNIAMFAQ